MPVSVIKGYHCHQICFSIGSDLETHTAVMQFSTLVLDSLLEYKIVHDLWFVIKKYLCVGKWFLGIIYIFSWL